MRGESIGRSRGHSWGGWIVGIICSAAAVALIRRFGGAFSHPHVPWTSPALAAGLALYLISQVLAGARWTRLLRASSDAGEGEERVRWREVLRIALIHNAFQNLLPARTGEAAFPLLARRALGVGVARATGALAVGRTLDLVLFPAVIGVGLAIAGLATRSSIGALGGTVAVGLALAGVLRFGVSHWGAGPISTAPGVLRRFVAGALAGAGRMSARTISSAAIETAGLATIRLVSLTAILMAIAPELSPARALGVTSGFFLIAALPIGGPAGVGTFELAWVIPLRAAGIDVAQATGIAITLHALYLGVALTLGGLAAGTVWRGGRSWLRRGWALPALLIGALALRLAGIDYGLPHLFHADEAHEVFRALRLGTGEFDLDLNRALKGGLFYLLFVEYAALCAVGLLTGWFDAPSDLGRMVAVDPSALWLLGRATVACFGAATVALVWRWSGRRAVGAFAAVLLALSFLHVKESQLVGLEIPLGFLAMATLHLLRDSGDGGERRRSWTAGGLLGAAAMTKITGGALLLPYLWAHARRSRWRGGGEGLAIAAVVYGAGNPGIWIHAREILAFASGSFTGDEAPALFQVAMLGGRSGPLFYFEALRLSFGSIAAVAAVAGVVWAILRGRRSDRLLLAFLLPYSLVVVGSQTVAVHRYIVPLLAPLALLAARALVDLAAPLRSPRVVLAAVACVVLVEPAFRTLRWTAEVRGGDTRTEALRWVLKNVPPGASLLLEGNQTFPAAQTVPVPVAEGHLVRQAAAYGASDPGKAKFLNDFAIPAARERPGPSFQPVYIDPFDGATTLAEHRRRGVGWAVLSSRIADGYRGADAWRLAPGVARLYADLWAEGEGVAQFEAIPWRRAGPLISILKMAPPSAVASAPTMSEAGS